MAGFTGLRSSGRIIGASMGLLAITAPVAIAGEADTQAVNAEAVSTNSAVKLSGFTIEGVGHHESSGLSKDSLQKYLDEIFTKLHSGQDVEIDGQPVSPRVDGEQVVIASEDLRLIAHGINKLYRDANFVAFAYLPDATPDEQGKIHFYVLEGHFGKVIVEGNKHYYSSVIKSYFEPLVGAPAELKDANTAAVMAQALPGLVISGGPRAGDTPGAVDLALKVDDSHRFDAFAGLDNYGGKTTGLYRANAGVSASNLTGLGEKTTIYGSELFSPSGSYLGGANFNIPFGRFFGGFASYSHNTIIVNSEQFAGLLDIRGYADSFEGGISEKLYTSETFNLAFRESFAHVKSRVSISDTAQTFRANIVDDVDSTLNTTMDLSYQNTHGLFGNQNTKFQDNFSLTSRVGLGGIMGDEEFFVSTDPETQALYGPSTNFSVLKGSVTHVQGTFARQALVVSVRGQYSAQFLGTVEQFSMGGPDSVRAYPISEALRDDGFSAQLEYRVNAPGFADVPVGFIPGRTWGQILSLKGFYDLAHGYNAPGRPEELDQKAVTLAGPGAGIHLEVPVGHYMIRSTALDFTAAYPTTKEVPSDESQKSTRLYASFTMNF